jgi:hypothetical protein
LGLRGQSFDFAPDILRKNCVRVLRSPRPSRQRRRPSALSEGAENRGARRALPESARSFRAPGGNGEAKSPRPFIRGRRILWPSFGEQNEEKRETVLEGAEDPVAVSKGAEDAGGRSPP